MSSRTYLAVFFAVVTLAMLALVALPSALSGGRLLLRPARHRDHQSGARDSSGANEIPAIEVQTGPLRTRINHGMPRVIGAAPPRPASYVGTP